VLLHSPDPTESRNPAERLQTYFQQSSGPETFLESVPSADFQLIKTRLSEIVAKYGILPCEGIVNFTGGNKLMATASYEWAKDSGWKSCYLERGNFLCEFIPESPHPTITTTSIDAQLLRDADTVKLLSAQLGESLLQHPGERLTLNAKGREMPREEIAKRLSQKDIHAGFSFRSLLVIDNPLGGPGAAGDNLEYAAAVVILKHGIPEVRRSVKLKSGSDSNVTESEIDIVFHWNGRLWMADCKAKSSGATKLRKLEQAIQRLGWNPKLLRIELDKLKGQLADTEARLIKEDLQQISEMGGLLGSAFAIRLQGLPEDVMRFARSRRPKVEVVHVAEMMSRIPQLLK